MGKKILGILLLACLTSCRPLPPRLGPDSGPVFRQLTIQAQYSAGDARQSGRVVWRAAGERGKFLFFGPLNQLALELDVEGDRALLVNFSQKAYWQGDFRQLLDRLWGIDLGRAEIEALLLQGAVPEAEFAARGIVATVKAGGRSVKLERGRHRLTLQVQKDATRPGSVVLPDYSRRFREAALEELLEHD